MKKKLVVLWLALAMVLSFTACGGNNKKAESAAPAASAATESAAPADSAAPAESAAAAETPAAE